MVQSKCTENKSHYLENLRPKVKPYLSINGQKIYAYRIYQNSTIVEDYVMGWRSALAHARKYRTNLFEYIQRVEILNIFTGEVLTLEEAELKAKLFKARKLKGAVFSGTT